MATNILPIQAALTIRASNHRTTTDNHRRKTSTTVTTTTHGGANWWSPLFGWSSDADYIDSKNQDQVKSTLKTENNNNDLEPIKPVKSRFSPGCFTEEKAKQLRLMTNDTASFHDMYHSAIANRLATDFSHRSSKDL